jgi:hypothetical protein
MALGDFAAVGYCCEVKKLKKLTVFLEVLKKLNVIPMPAAIDYKKRFFIFALTFLTY